MVIVWDSGLSRAYDIRRQLRLFLRTRDTYERRGRLNSFPALLVLAPDTRRAHLWQAQTLRLATERWLTHPLFGGALALEETGRSAAGIGSEEEHPAIPFPPTSLDTVNPWQAGWYSFAQPQFQPLMGLLRADVGAGHGIQREDVAASESKPHIPRVLPARASSYHERVRLARLTLRLDACSLRLLALLYLHPLLSTQQLAVVLGVQPASMERMLRQVRRLDLVQTSMWSGVQQVALSDCGVLLLAGCAHLPGTTRVPAQAGSQPPRVLRRYQREARSLARTPEHTEGVYSFFNALLQTCAVERTRGHDAALLWWETGSACARAFRDSGGWHTIRPDGAGEWRIDGQRFRFWLEWDRGTMGPRDLTAKFAAYTRYLQLGEWRVDGNDPLPALLIVTSDVPQEAWLLDA
ncbi:MAG: replication-relaxation family protein, partial [Ktedonobacterales bacterium]